MNLVHASVAAAPRLPFPLNPPMGGLGPGRGLRPAGQPGLPPRQDIRFARAADGTRLAHASQGHGLPVVKTATWLSHLEVDCASPVWSHLIDAFSGRHRFIRYDERGCGLSDREVPTQDFESWVGDLETIVDDHAQPQVALLGISQGAAVAIAYAARHPERVSHLVIHGGYARGRLARGGGPQLEREAELMCEMAELGWGRAEDTFRQFFTSQFIPGGTPEQHRWFNELQRLSCSPAAAARFMREFNRIDVTEALARVRCPTLVLHSKGDLRVPFDEGRLIAGGIAHARFVPIDSANHLLLGQEPAWLHWLSEVDDFLGDGRRGAGAATAGPTHPALAELTARQRELLELIAQGRDNAQIAAVLGVAEKTVRNHITAIFARLQVENRAQAIVLSRKAGLGEQR